MKNYYINIIRGEEDYGLLAVDYFLWDEVLPYAESNEDIPTTKKEIELKNISNTESKSLHDEVKEKLKTIGKLLGFESHSEVKITTGAIKYMIFLFVLMNLLINFH